MNARLLNRVALSPDLIYEIGLKHCQDSLDNAPKIATFWIHCHYSSLCTTDAYYAVINGCVHGVTNEGSEYIDRKFESVAEMVEVWKLPPDQPCHVINLDELRIVLDHIALSGDAELQQFIYSCFEMSVSQANEVYGEQFLIQCEEFHKLYKQQVAQLEFKLMQQQHELNVLKTGCSLTIAHEQALKLNCLG